MFQQKSVITNLVSLLFVCIGLLTSKGLNEIFFSIGMFALSGSLTNSLAVYMLFEKVFFLYGSGVIIDRFQEIKLGIKNLVLREFFSEKNIDNFFTNNVDKIDKKFLQNLDYEKIFDGLLDAIEDSKIGGMLAMIGGRKSLLPLKEPIIQKLKLLVDKKIENFFKETKNEKNSSSLRIDIEKIIDKKLSELKPRHVKKIIEDMIRQHLGWLVVWGGVFGGVFGLCFGLTNYFKIL